VGSEPDTAPRPALTRIAKREADSFKPERIRKASTPAVYWDGESWTPAWIIAWCRHYGEWFVLLRTRRDVWRDREAWYAYQADALLPVRPDPRDVREWLPRRPLD